MGEPTLQELSKVQALLEERMNSNLAQQKSAFDKMQTDQARRDAHRDGILAEQKNILVELRADIAKRDAENRADAERRDADMAKRDADMSQRHRAELKWIFGLWITCTFALGAFFGWPF